MAKSFLSLLILITVFSFNNQVVSQQYYVSFTADTIPGKVITDTYADYSEEIEFKNPYNTRVRLTPYNATVVRYSDKTQIRSVSISGKRYFMELIYDGPVSVYYFKRNTSQFGTDVISYVLAKTGGDTIEVDQSNFQSRMTEFLADCTPLQNKIINNKYKYRHLKDIAIDYEACDVKVDSKSNFLLQEIDKFRSSLDKSAQDLNKNDIHELLNDIQKRYKNNQDIPDFLWSSLIALVESDKELMQKAKLLKTHVEN